MKNWPAKIIKGVHINVQRTLNHTPHQLRRSHTQLKMCPFLGHPPVASTIGSSLRRRRPRSTVRTVCEPNAAAVACRPHPGDRGAVERVFVKLRWLSRGGSDISGRVRWWCKRPDAAQDSGSVRTHAGVFHQYYTRCTGWN